MPQKAALIAALITDRPLRMRCLTDKSGLAADEIRTYLRRVERVISLRRGTDRCRSCGIFTEVWAMFRPSG